MGGTLIKIILIVLLIVLFRVYRSGSSGRRTMGRFMPLVALGFAVLAVLFPQFTQKLASLVGVTYGASLVVYLTIMGLLLMVVAMRGHQSKQTRDITLLARKIAISEARSLASEKKDGS